MGSALGELEAGTSALLTVLLALLHTRIAREEARLLEALAEFGVVDLERARDAVADRAGLAARSAAVHRHHDVELVDGLGERERLLDDHLEHFVREVFIETTAIDRDLTAARADVHTRRRGLPSSGSVIFNQCQGTSS